MRQKATKWGAVGALIVYGLVMIGCLLWFCPGMAHGAALTDSIPQVKRSEYAFPARMYAGVIYRGGLVAVSNGIAYPAANNADWRVIGVADYTVDNQSTAAEYSATRTISVSQGIFAFANVITSGSGTNATYSLAVTDVGKPAYVVDDQTVGAASNVYSCVAGTVAYVEPDLKRVWIDVGKAWAETVAVQPYDLPSSTNGLANGRLYIYSNFGTNTVGIVP